MALQIIKQAIEQSKGQNEIVHISDTEIAGAGLRLSNVVAELEEECEDFAAAQGRYEYWGKDVDGAEWRVHVMTAREERDSVDGETYTLDEWLDAAGGIGDRDPSMLRSAWSAGEDPAEYAVESSTVSRIDELLGELHGVGDAGGNLRVTVEAALTNDPDVTADEIREMWAEATEEHAANVAHDEALYAAGRRTGKEPDDTDACLQEDAADHAADVRRMNGDE